MVNFFPPLNVNQNIVKKSFYFFKSHFCWKSSSIHFLSGCFYKSVAVFFLLWIWGVNLPVALPCCCCLMESRYYTSSELRLIDFPSHARLQTRFAEPKRHRPNRCIGERLLCVCGLSVRSRKIPYLAGDRPRYTFFSLRDQCRGETKKQKSGRDENKHLLSDETGIASPPPLSVVRSCSEKLKGERLRYTEGSGLITGSAL